MPGVLHASGGLCPLTMHASRAACLLDFPRRMLLVRTQGPTEAPAGAPHGGGGAGRLHAHCGRQEPQVGCAQGGLDVLYIYMVLSCCTQMQ